MGLYLGPRFLKVRLTKRGTRVSVGPRLLRYHTGAGGSGISTGAGPVSYYHPLGGHRTRRPASRPSEPEVPVVRESPERGRQIRLYNRLFAVQDYRDRKAADRDAKTARKQARRDRKAAVKQARREHGFWWAWRS